MTLERHKRLGPGPRSIERGSTFKSRGNGLRRSSRPRPRRQISEASDEQREAALLHERCSACGRRRTHGWVLDPAHLAKRSQGGCDDALCTPFALCRNVFNGAGCHRPFDDGELDLLRHVNAQPDRYREALQHALEHLNVVQLVERLAGARTQWSDHA